MQRGGDCQRAFARDARVVAAAVELDADVDDAAGVDNEVGCPEHAAPLEQRRDVGRRQLIVGGAGDHRRLNLSDRLCVEDATERAGRQHVDRRRHRLRRRPPGGAERDRVGAARRVDVGEHELRPGLGQQPRERQADVTQPDDRDRSPAQAAAAERALAARLDRSEHAERGHRARVARPAGTP